MKKIIISTLLFFVIFSSFCQDKYLTDGNTFLKSGEFEKAEKTFRDGISVDPANLVYQNQLGLTLIQQKKYSDAEVVLNMVLKSDSNNIGGIWYSGIGNFKNGKNKEAILRFEKALTLLDKNSGQFYSANWFIGKAYSNLLKTEGLTYSETDRMFECFEEYLRLQPNADDAAKIREYVDHKKKRRPTSNVLKWVDL